MEEDQAPEEIPMDVVLSEIRQILTKDMDALDLQDKGVSSVAEAYREEPDYFLLTPQMRCDLSDTGIVREQTERVLSKLHDHQDGGDLSPALEKWLNAHLPQMIEDILNRRLS